MKTERLIIAMDNGKMNGKAICGEQRVFYPNRYSEGFADVYNTNETDSFNVSYQGAKWTIGAIGTQNNALEGKETNFHKISTLTALTRFIDEREERPIYLIYGESMNKYFNEDHKAKIKYALEGQHRITVNGRAFTFKIENVHILPEGIGHILQDITNNMGYRYICDIGGTTVNWIEVNNGKPIKEKSFSRGLGFHNLTSIVATTLSQNGLDVADEVVPEYIKDRNNIQNSALKEIINNCIEKQLREIDSILEKRNVKISGILEHNNVTFVGGTSGEFKDEIIKHYRTDEGKIPTILDDCMFATVKGFYDYGVAVYGI